MNTASREEIEELLRAGGVVSSLRPTPAFTVIQSPGGPKPGGPAPGPSEPAHGVASAGKAGPTESATPTDLPPPVSQQASTAQVIDGVTYDTAPSEPIAVTPAGDQIGWSAGRPMRFDFLTPGEMLAFYCPELAPHEWQKEELHRLGGYLNLADAEPTEPTDSAPLFYNLVAANGSGKDAFIIKPTAVWEAACRIRHRTIITSATQEQLSLQTFTHLVDYCEAINRYHGYKVFEIKQFYIYNKLTGSEIIGRVTNTPGRVEGFHPFPSPVGAGMTIIINEAKSIPDEVFGAMSRFTGYNKWLQISSPGPESGRFYQSCVLSTEHLCELNKPFKRHITAFECKHLTTAMIDAIKRDCGENSIEYQTGVLARFFSSALDVVIPASLLDYAPPAACTYNLPVVAGLDLAFSTAGDESWFCVWHGNRELYAASIKTDSADRIHAWITTQLALARARYGLDPTNCRADAGGVGKPILSRVVESGWPITTVRNESPAFRKDYYLNLGAEMWFKVKRLVEQKILIIPRDELLRTQLTSRKALLHETTQKLRLEPKAEHKARKKSSPDRADAMILALAGYPLDILLAAPPSSTARPVLNPRRDPAGFAQYCADYAFNNVDRETTPTPQLKLIGLNHANLARR